jgi:hypothetical protein
MSEPTTERDRIKERVAKLLNMTVDRGASEAEATFAAEEAARLMAHYDIEASELSIRAARAIRRSAKVRKYGNVNVAVPTARHVAQCCDCMYWVATEIDPRDADLSERWQRLQRVVVFFGLPEDAELAAFFFDQISSIILAQIDVYKASEEYRRETEAGVNGRTAITSFIDGIETALCSQLDAIRDAKHREVEAATGLSLVVVKEAQIKEDFEATGIKLVSGGGSYRGAGSAGAQASGRAAGGRVSLSSGVGAGRSVGALR